ncbi:MAG TPA: hypothetical protein VFU97_16670 [Xanthobacteraceae bacterium]|nr:hypothetical protein [Xanthobacteraceae bacterium]
MSRLAEQGTGSERLIAGVLPLAALDERLALVGTSGSGKTYAAKGLVEHLLAASARVCVVDPLGVWWGLRSGADGTTPGYPVVVFGGRHADIALDESMGAALGRVVGSRPLACVVDLSDLGSAAARRRFMAAFAEALYEANLEPLHLVLDEADLWAPQRPVPEAHALLGRIEEIVRRGRVRGFIPWLITQRPAVVHKDVLSQADILVAMKLTSSQDRDAVGGWIEGQADRAEGRRILADLPKLARGEGYLWAPSDGVLARVAFPLIRTYDSSRTPKRGERIATPRTLAEVDLSAITAALAAAPVPTPTRERVGSSKPRPDNSGTAGGNHRRLIELEHQLAERDQLLTEARTRIATLEAEAAGLRWRLAHIASLAAKAAPSSIDPSEPPPSRSPVAFTAPAYPPAVHRDARTPPVEADRNAALHPAARKLLTALAQHAPARFTWGQAATLAGLKPSGGHYNTGRKQLRDLGLVEESTDLVTVSVAGMKAVGEVPPTPSSPDERLALWCARLPSPAPEMLRALAAQGERYMETTDLAVALGKKPTGGHWNSGIALLRNNGLVEVSGRRLRVSALFR